MKLGYISKIRSNFQDSASADAAPVLAHTVRDVSFRSLPQTSVRREAIRGEALSGLIWQLTSSHACALDGLAMAVHGKILFAQYKPPYSRQHPHMTNSTCKTITAIAVMFALSEQRLQLTDPVISFFPEYEGMMTHRSVKQMTVEHLLTMTSGSRCNEAITVAEENWAKAFLLAECQSEPGTQFVYNSMNSYMLAAILTKVTGQSLVEYLTPRLFKPLGMSPVKWEVCPCGIERGGWGLHIQLEDMLKIGIFLAQDGMYETIQLIPKTYIRKMKEANVAQGADALATGYGYQLWHLPDACYMLSGMYGQHVIIDEKRQIVFATNAHNDKMFPDSVLVRSILAYLHDADHFVPDLPIRDYMASRQIQHQLEAFRSGFPAYRPGGKQSFYAFRREQLYRLQKEKEKLCVNLQPFHRHRIHVEQGDITLFPYMLQGMYPIPPFHVKDLLIRMDEDSVHVQFFKARTKGQPRESLTVCAGYCSYMEQTLTIGQNLLPAAAAFHLRKDEDAHWVLVLEIVFPESGFSRQIKLFRYPNRTIIESMEYPDMLEIVEQVLHGEAVIAGNTYAVSDKIPEPVKLYLEQKVEPRLCASIHALHTK